MVVVKGWSAEIYIDGGKVGKAQEINVDIDTSVGNFTILQMTRYQLDY